MNAGYIQNILIRLEPQYYQALKPHVTIVLLFFSVNLVVLRKNFYNTDHFTKIQILHVCV